MLANPEGPLAAESDVLTARVFAERHPGCFRTTRNIVGMRGRCPRPISGQGATVTDSDYDDFAEAYARQNETGLFNAYYEQPAMLRLAGDVRGRRILDVGCGSGPTIAKLREAGADVSGFDRSAGMIGFARERLGQHVDLRVADLADPLPYADAEFDDAIASLVLHYLEDWAGPLTELRRVLKPGGRLLVSVNHPVIFPVVYPDSDYFAITKYTEDYDFAGQSVADLLPPAVARHDGFLCGRGVPHRHDQRARAGSGHATRVAPGWT